VRRGELVEHPSASIAEEVRTPRAAAVAGIVFAVLLTVVFALLGPGSSASERGADWYYDASNRRLVRTSLVLLPFVGIAFLWFIGVIRSLLGTREDKLFATVFLGSGLLFVAMVFIATALLGGVVAVFDEGPPLSAEVIRLAEGINAVLVGTLAIKMAGIFTLSVSTLGRRTQLVPTWLVWWGSLTALVLLLAPVGTYQVAILFPVWVLAFSTRILVASYRPERQPDLGGSAGSA
jgi:hypothetical protein